jgi:hypothetical protein
MAEINLTIRPDGCAGVVHRMVVISLNPRKGGEVQEILHGWVPKRPRAVSV